MNVVLVLALASFLGGEIPKPTMVRIRNANYLREVYDFNDVIALENEDESIVGQIDDLEIIGEDIFLLDSLQKTVFQFKIDGNFVRKIGNRGQSYNEYTNPRFIAKTGLDEISIMDEGTRKILCFSRDGAFKWYQPRSLKEISRGDFFWNKNILYASDCYPNEDNYHALLDFADKKKPTKIASFFPKNPKVKKIRPNFGFTAFAKVINQIWTSEPYNNSIIQIFDLNGQLIKKLQLDFPEPVTFDDFSMKMDRNDINRVYNRPGVRRIYSTRHFVIVDLGKYYQIYDFDGKLVRKKIKKGLKIIYCNNDTLILDILIVEKNMEGFYFQVMPEVYESMKEKGFDIHESDDENPYLWVGSL